jgi:hypothetical protein
LRDRSIPNHWARKKGEDARDGGELTAIRIYQRSVYQLRIYQQKRCSQNRGSRQTSV